MNHSSEGKAHSGQEQITLPVRPVRPVVLGVVVCGVLGLATALAFDSYRKYQDEMLEAQEAADAARKSSLLRTTQFLQQSKVLLAKLSDDAANQGRTATHCPAVLEELRRTQPVYTNLVRLDASGQVLCDAKASSQGQASLPALANDFLQVVRTKQFTVGKPAQADSSERWTARLLLPIKNGTGQLAGALALSVDLLNLDLIGSPNNLPHNVLVGIINGDGTIVARSEGGMLRIGRPANSDVAKTVLRNREGTARGPDYLGSDRLFSYAPVPDSDWIVFAALDLQGNGSPMMQLEPGRLAALAALLLAAVGLVVLWRRNAHPKPG